MAKRKRVIHVATGQIFKTAAEAERAFGIPSGVLSWDTKLGKACHGEVFKYLDDDELKEFTNNSENAEKDDAVEHKPASIFKHVERLTDRNDKDQASRYFNSLGYDTEVIGGVLVFYQATYDDVFDLVRSSGYSSSWGCSSRSRSETKQSTLSERY